MTFAYKQFPLAVPVPGGRAYRAKPFLPVTLIGPRNSIPHECLADTGADDTVFPESFAVKAGIDLTNAPTGRAPGVGMVGATLQFALVILRVASGSEQREWQAWVGFTSAPLRRPLLGHAAFLEFFDAVFRGEREEVILDVNGRYAGT